MSRSGTHELRLGEFVGFADQGARSGAAAARLGDLALTVGARRTQAALVCTWAAFGKPLSALLRSARKRLPGRGSAGIFSMQSSMLDEIATKVTAGAHAIILLDAAEFLPRRCVAVLCRGVVEEACRGLL